MFKQLNSNEIYIRIKPSYNQEVEINPTSKIKSLLNHGCIKAMNKTKTKTKIRKICYYNTWIFALKQYLNQV
jgi:citrate lyase gamma subunit